MILLGDVSRPSLSFAEIKPPLQRTSSENIREHPCHAGHKITKQEEKESQHPNITIT